MSKNSVEKLSKPIEIKDEGSGAQSKDISELYSFFFFVSMMTEDEAG